VLGAFDSQAAADSFAAAPHDGAACPRAWSWGGGVSREAAASLLTGVGAGLTAAKRAPTLAGRAAAVAASGAGGGALADAVSSNFQAASALSFGLGAFVLLGAMKVLVAEGNALWMLYAAPVSISRILLQKTLMWACLGLVYTAVALCVCGAMVGSLAPVDLVYAMMACAGVFIYAFIGAGIGILGSDPLETEVQRRIKGSSVYLFMILSGMYGYALYAPSMWTRVGQIVLSSLLALALWQKVRDRQPFMLDPVSAPAPQISLADGLIAALAFFVVQGVASIIAEHCQFEKGAALSIGFFTAGASVAFFVLLLKRSTPSFFKALDRVHGKSLGASVGIGVSAGGVAGFVGLLFLFALERVPFLQRLNDGEAPIQQIHGWWLLGVALVAAPLFEEFIFRGLVLVELFLLVFLSFSFSLSLW
jgi:membrane protease YdiL (CAAX protease family)